MQLRQAKLDYDEHFKVTVRKQIAEERARLDPERAIMEKFLDRKWVALAGDKADNAQLLQTEADRLFDDLIQ